MANSVNPDQSLFRATLFACILKFASNVWQLFAADNFSRLHFQMHFLGALRLRAWSSPGYTVTFLTKMISLTHISLTSFL